MMRSCYVITVIMRWQPVIFCPELFTFLELDLCISMATAAVKWYKTELCKLLTFIIIVMLWALRHEVI